VSQLGGTTVRDFAPIHTRLRRRRPTRSSPPTWAARR
jgi:hypothetical protein